LSDAAYVGVAASASTWTVVIDVKLMVDILHPARSTCCPRGCSLPATTMWQLCGFDDAGVDHPDMQVVH
jgi:hypothetical protein